jgi:hypothetical protein
MNSECRWLMSSYQHQLRQSATLSSIELDRQEYRVAPNAYIN